MFVHALFVVRVPSNGKYKVPFKVQFAKNRRRKHIEENKTYMGGTRQEGKMPTNLEFYPLRIGFS